MPIYKALILNKEINVNYEEDQKDKLVKAINVINSKLASYNNMNGKISDSKLLSFLAIKLQAELLELNEKKDKKIILEKKIENSNNQNINLNDKIYQLQEENKLLKEENKLINNDIVSIQNQINAIINLLKKIYEE